MYRYVKVNFAVVTKPADARIPSVSSVLKRRNTIIHKLLLEKKYCSLYVV